MREEQRSQEMIEMTHFVSQCCEGWTCSFKGCGKPATHKVGEEIPPDEPCETCGKTGPRWAPPLDGPGLLDLLDEHLADPATTACSNPYHIAEQGVPRHNLTAHVCCEHFTVILGPATGCPA